MIEILAATALAAVLILTILFVVSSMDRTHRMLIHRDEKHDEHGMLIDLVRNDLYHAREIKLPGGRKIEQKEQIDPQSPEELLKRHKEMLKGLSPELARQLAVHLKRNMGLDITQSLPEEDEEKKKKEPPKDNLDKDLITIEGYYSLDRGSLDIVHRPTRVTYRIIELGEHRCLVREQEVLNSRSNLDTYLELLDIGVSEFEVRVPEIEEAVDIVPTLPNVKPNKKKKKDDPVVQPDYAIMKLDWVDEEKDPIEKLILLR